MTEIISTIIVQIVINGLLAGGVYSILGMGLNLVYGVGKVVNFAQGDLLMIGMYTTYWLFSLLAIDPWISLIITAPLLFIIGVTLNKILLEPMRKKPDFETSHVFLLFGTSILLQNLALLFWKSDYRSTTTFYTGANWNVLGMYFSVGRVVAFICSVIIAISLYFFLSKTDLGKAIRATADNSEAAKMMGINVPRIHSLALGIGAALTGAAAALISPLYFVYPQIGFTFLFIMFPVVVIGGMGSFTGAFVGGLLVGVVEGVVGFYVDPVWGEIAIFLCLIITLVVKPTGLFGKR